MAWSQGTTQEPLSDEGHRETHASKSQTPVVLPSSPVASPSQAGKLTANGSAVEITVWCYAVACTVQEQGVSGISKAFSAAPAIRPAILHRRFDPLIIMFFFFVLFARSLVTFGC